MKTVSKRFALACASALATVLVLSPPAAANDPCSFNGTVATCSGNQSGGILYIALPPLFPDLTSLAVSNLTSPISPNPGFVGVDYLSVFGTPQTPSTNGFSAPLLTINTDSSAVINVTTANATNPTTVGAQGIVVFTVGGNGSDGTVVDNNGSLIGTVGGAGGEGGDVTINNGGNITADSSARQALTRAEEFGETGELGDLPGDINALQGLVSQFSADPNDPTYVFEIFTISQYLDGNSVNFSSEQAFIASLQQAIVNEQAREAFLGGITSPEQTSQTIYGAIEVTSIGGNGGVGPGFYPLIPVANGGDGGAGGTITITNNATIQANGQLVAGIYALSVGGHGGQSEDPNDGNPGIVGYGFGGHGGVGGAITITNNGTIETTGDSSPGVFAESLGGQSGDGGQVGESDPNYVFPAGVGGLVTVNNPGVITTSGASAYGILAESVGGLGLSGGDAKPGGAGGDVVVDVAGQITTTGLSAYGVFARSIGGNGGNGSDEEDGGPGGASNLVQVTVDKGATITTSGDGAIGVFAQSLGGEGGFGGSGDNIFYADGGGGGNGGQGGDVQVSNAGTITTSGAFAYGVFGQALGGAGGFGGSASGLVSESGGGGGGTGAGSVTADNSGTIITTGLGANALYAQSVAGAGGDAGSSGGFVALGSDGGNGAQTACEKDPTQCLNGGVVTATNDGALITEGNSATAIFAQSIGGGGGNGGSASGVFSFGGSGGAGGNGGMVTVTNGDTGTIQVSGSNGAMGIFAESVGGGGGNGGDASAFGTELSVAIGGSGGSGGMGGNVTVSNAGVIELNGYNDTAIFVQSVGGGGGNGGDATSFSANGLLAVSVAVGGTGGGGGNGGVVVVGNTGVISTEGDFSNAVFAQSVGGGGGRGGEAFSFAAAVGGDDIPAISASIAVGGNGGGGGIGNEVDVTNSGSITTLDWDSFGIFAQSVGGGGGVGGSSTARAAASSPGGFSFTFSLALGGNGGSAGAGGPVDVSNAGTVTTFGDLSPAIFAQSVGGGGGYGGDGSAVAESLLSKNSVDLSFSIGGKGGAGGDGGTATVTNSGAVLTMGAMSPGITSQSVGGGGGDGGDGTTASLIPGEDDVIPSVADINGNVSDALKKLGELQGEDADEPEGDSSFGKETEKESEGEKPESFNLSFSLGGSGGAAGNGVLASVTNTGDITTLGWMSDGIFAQSVGGGGGNGGDGEADGSDQVNIPIGVGGSQGASGVGGPVNVINSGDITTYGDISFGIRAQSVGGGGGSAGAGSASSGLSFEGSVGIPVSVGGNGGAAGNGGTVTVQQSGSIVTLGIGSIGIFAQSVGGGGGSAGTGNPDEFSPGIGIGGSSGADGNGGDVTVTMTSGSITTTGDYAHGIFAQSVGGGGGLVGEVAPTALVESDPFGGFLSGTPVPYTVGMVNALPLITTSPFLGNNNTACDQQPTGFLLGIPIVFQGGTTCGNGGKILVQTTGTITTYGNNAAGIFAQSIGGGGGVGSETAPGAAGPLSGPLAFTAGVALISSNGGIGTADTVTVIHNGNIQATGENSIGIFAQSMNGVADINDNAAGSNARGANITVTVNGVIEGGSGAGAGIFMSGGDQNTLTNGSGGNISALSGLAIIASDGDDTVDNFGTITGDIGLGAGTNAIINEQSGVLQTGPLVYIGPGNALINNGTLSPGGVGMIAATTIVGNYVQTPTGTLLVDVNFQTGQSDVVTVQGSASLAGKALLGPVAITTIKPGQFFTVLTATGTLTNNGISIDNTLTVDYGVKFVGNSFEVGVTSVQFDLGGTMLTAKEQAVSNNIQAIWAAGGGNMSNLLNYLAGLTNPATYQAVLDHLNPGPIQNNNSQSLFAGGSAVNTLMSCPGTDSAYDALREHECFWARGSGGTAHRSSTTSTPSFDSSSYEYAVGGQFEVAPTWFVGLSADIAQDITNVETLAHESTQSVNAGVVVKHEMGDWLLAAAVDGEFGWNRLARYVDFPTPTTTATSSPTNTLLDGRLRLAYLASAGDAYFKPEIAVDGYYASASSATEEGAGPLDMIFAASNKTFASGTVGLEAGLLEAFRDGSSMRPYVVGDLTAYTDNTWDASARFAGAPVGTPALALHDTFPSVIERLAGGLEVNLHGGSLRFEYEHRYGARYFDQTGSLKVRIPF